MRSPIFADPMPSLSRSFCHHDLPMKGLYHTFHTVVMNASDPIIKYISPWTSSNATDIPGSIMRSDALGTVLSASLPVNTSRIEYIGFNPMHLTSYAYCLDACPPNNILAMNGTNSSAGNLGPLLATLLSISVDPKEQHTLTVYNLPNPIAGNTTRDITFHSLVATIRGGGDGSSASNHSRISSDSNTMDPMDLAPTSSKAQGLPLEPTDTEGSQAPAPVSATDTSDSRSAINTGVGSAFGNSIGPLALQVNHTNIPTDENQGTSFPSDGQERTSVSDPTLFLTTIPNPSVPTRVLITGAGVPTDGVGSLTSTPSGFVPTTSPSWGPGESNSSKSSVLPKAIVGAITTMLVVSVLLVVIAWLVWRKRQQRRRGSGTTDEAHAESIYDETVMLEPVMFEPSIPPSLSRVKPRRNPGLITSPKPMPRIPLPALPDEDPFTDPVNPQHNPRFSTT